ncbi:mannan endo-1-4-beta-mannosidase (beta-mannanase) (1-4-beta-D-mannan mannanohydrolase) [Brachionus plicatilis]|uniref:Mannan endo-1-4-beta-mannosidase (Beta-mannanase) (1-4-beta-D-mannan mannanohydrolase) n=1 Tax=Brachionus plicatilis TaxID=10195 RepID=A0A3M7RS97_BRAPC|nr:mannan endo-1-4-beta-mannosidase (beta-mannanase) (1-4-beta-D-mannan mannanohydrolase) [Brachionus plicatilis]
MKAIAGTGANSLRILWLRDNEIKSKGLNDNNLVDAIQQAINNKLIPIVHLWMDSGKIGDSNWDKRDYLREAGRWWVSKINLLKKFEDKLLINVLNEWSTWRKGRALNDQAGHKLSDILWYAEDVIIPIRKTGWRGTLVIDSLAMAQSPHPILQYGQQLINKDPLKNLIFSIHAYADWRDETPNNNYTPYDKYLLASIVKKNIPLMLGEFSNKHPDSNKVIKYMNAPKIMKICQENRIGWLAWSLKGNGVVNGVDLSKVLDISYNHDKVNLTPWGYLLKNDPNDFKTSVKSSMFL